MKKTFSKAYLANVILAVIFGYVSFLLEQPVLSLGMAMFLFFVLSMITRHLLGIGSSLYDWMKKTMTTFFVPWFITWTIFINLRLLGLIV